MSSASVSAARNPFGFTLLEVLLVMTIIGMLTAVSLPVYETFVRRNDLDLTTEQLADVLRRAQTYSRAVNRGSGWSVEIEADTITLFMGSSFGSRNTAYDETIDVPGTVTPSGTTEVRFSKFAGLPSATGTITLSSNANSTRTVTINAKGMVDY